MLSTFQPLRMQLLPGGRRPALQSPWHSRDTRHALLLSCGPQQPASSTPSSSSVATAAASARRLGSCSSQHYAARLPGRAPSLLSSTRRRRPAAPPASSTAAATAAAASCSTSISPWSTLAVLCTCAAAAQAAEEHTAWGRLLSAPVLTLLLSLAAAGAGLLPPTSPVYDVVWSHLMPLAVALLLLEQDVSGIRAAGGPVLASFLLGAGTMVVGAAAAWLLCKPAMAATAGSSAAAAKLAACLVASYVGGSVNFIAVAAATQLPTGLVPGAMAADNLGMLLLLGLLMAAPLRALQQPQEQQRGGSMLLALAGRGGSGGGSSGGGRGPDPRQREQQGRKNATRAAAARAGVGGAAAAGGGGAGAEGSSEGPLGLDGAPLLTEPPPAYEVDACLEETKHGDNHTRVLPLLPKRDTTSASASGSKGGQAGSGSDSSGSSSSSDDEWVALDGSLLLTQPPSEGEVAAAVQESRQGINYTRVLPVLPKPGSSAGDNSSSSGGSSSSSGGCDVYGLDGECLFTEEPSGDEMAAVVRESARGDNYTRVLPLLPKLDGGSDSSSSSKGGSSSDAPPPAAAAAAAAAPSPVGKCGGCPASGVTAQDSNPLLTRAPATGDAMSSITAAGAGQQHIRAPPKPPSYASFTSGTAASRAAAAAAGGSSSAASNSGSNGRGYNSQRGPDGLLEGCGCCAEALDAIAAASPPPAPLRGGSSSSSGSGALALDGSLLLTEEPDSDTLAAAAAAAAASRGSSGSSSGGSSVTVSPLVSGEFELLASLDKSSLMQRLRRAQQKQQKQQKQVVPVAAAASDARQPSSKGGSSSGSDSSGSSSSSDDEWVALDGSLLLTQPPSEGEVVAAVQESRQGINYTRVLPVLPKPGSSAGDSGSSSSGGSSGGCDVYGLDGECLLTEAPSVDEMAAVVRESARGDNYTRVLPLLPKLDGGSDSKVGSSSSSSKKGSSSSSDEDDSSGGSGGAGGGGVSSAAGGSAQTAAQPAASEALPPSAEAAPSSSSSSSSSSGSGGILTASSAAAAVAAAAVAAAAAHELATRLNAPALHQLLLGAIAVGISAAATAAHRSLTAAAASSSPSSSTAAAAAAAGPGPFSGSSQLGQVLVGVFFAALGASCCCPLPTLLCCIPLLGFIAVMTTTHWALLWGLGGRLLGLQPEVLLCGSAAAIGGPATAAGLASAKGWGHLVQPSLLCGSLGYALGTGAGLLLAQGLGVLP